MTAQNESDYGDLNGHTTSTTKNGTIITDIILNGVKIPLDRPIVSTWKLVAKRSPIPLDNYGCPIIEINPDVVMRLEALVKNKMPKLYDNTMDYGDIRKQSDILAFQEIWSYNPDKIRL